MGSGHSGCAESYFSNKCCIEGMCAGSSAQVQVFSTSQVVDLVLGQAVARGDYMAAERALDAGADPNTSEWIELAHAEKANDDCGPRLAEPPAVHYSRTPLMWACSHGRQDLITLLLTNGADASVEDARGWTALCYALAAGHVQIASTLFVDIQPLVSQEQQLKVVESKRPQILAQVRDEVADITIASEVCHAMNATLPSLLGKRPAKKIVPEDMRKRTSL
mmetsp:Transcript_44091/g.104329  ORF Transcript_44091/g.104329 Transcript_44091/m.104329 type:complete len:221 (+) Transcript_44091:137-799(+)